MDESAVLIPALNERIAFLEIKLEQRDKTFRSLVRFISDGILTKEQHVELTAMLLHACYVGEKFQ